MLWACSTSSSKEEPGDAVALDSFQPDLTQTGGCTAPLGELTFIITNDTATTRYFKGEWPLDLSREVDGMLEPFDHQLVCTGICHVCEPIYCGTCPTEARAVAPGESIQFTWNGAIYGWPLTTCTGEYGEAECAEETCAPAGSYLVEFWQSAVVQEYYDDMGNCPEEGIMSELANPQRHGVLFEFAAGGGVVELSLVTGSQ